MLISITGTAAAAPVEVRYAATAAESTCACCR